MNAGQHRRFLSDNGGRPILLVSLSANHGGADVRVLQVARALHGYRPYAVAVLRNSTTHKLLEKAALNTLPVPFGRGDPRVAMCLYKYMRERRVEVVESHNPQSHLWSLVAALMAGVRRRIWTIHSDYRRVGTPLRAFVLTRLLKFGAGHGCRFIVVSGREAEYLHSIGIPADRIRLSVNGVPKPSGTASSSLRASLAWGQETKVICVVARLDAIKGHSVLFKALQQLRPSRAQLRCLILGDGPLKQTLRQEVAEAGLDDIVFFGGFRDDALAAVSECDLFCLPSYSEGLPFALLEAAMLGIPTVASAVGEIPGHFAHAEMARLVSPGDPAELAREIAWVLDHPRQAAGMAAAAKKMVIERFSVARMMQDVLTEYDSPHVSRDEREGGACENSAPILP
jgi:glycosyltransferase involved in cell wall biosynthesis